jgi:hypothetical protein
MDELQHIAMAGGFHALILQDIADWNGARHRRHGSGFGRQRIGPGGRHVEA